MSYQVSNKPFERNNYFNGKLISDEDFKTEQKYFVEKRRLHNKYLHGCGIVFGLELSIINNRLRINPGLALDCYGNEIVLCESFELDLPKEKSTQYIVIRYTELLISPVPSHASTEEKQNYSRIKESFEVTYKLKSPLNEEKLIMPGSWKYKAVDGIPLGQIKYRGSQWKIAHCFHRPLIK